MQQIHRLFFVTIFLITFVSKGICQEKYHFICNDSIKYRFGYVGMKVKEKNTFIPSKYIVKMVLSDTEKEKVFAIKKNVWLALLADSSTDWAANLLLYYMYKRDAIEYYTVVKSRDKWILINKKDEELKYWKKYLK